MFSLVAMNRPSQANEPVEVSKKAPSAQLEFVKYFGLTVASSYGFLFLINKNGNQPVTERRLVGYAVGIPSLIGLGMYLGVVAGLKPFTSLVT